MGQQGRASWLPSALLLLWVPGSLSLSCPRTVEGTVGGSLIVQCCYEKEFTEYDKYWSKENHLFSWKTVWSTDSERNGRVSVRDHPANLTFTVTLENLTTDDEGTYACGIDVPQGLDPISEVVVSVFPAAPTSATYESPTSITSANTSTVTTEIPAESTTLPVVEVTSITNSQKDQNDTQQNQDWRCYVLLSLSALLLLLLAGASLWACRRRRTRAGGNPEPLQKPRQGPQQTEPCNANLELQTLPRGERKRPRQEETEYSTVGAPREEVHYSSVVFNTQSQDSKDTAPRQRPWPQEPEYSVIRKT
ncbi:LOW QUALITY PROTEIN: CMRF35-like molecule 8 [Rousettus aegyptiacus]|uniref:LOW QUALITY PROTEIN: CMRF35-like molecule 8 n=1 Tax=Rousettus aegyptiacus TaxID=9407 RepID=UPI00168D8D59|nr:LOW QUALITY PROTEIN: CMRF35-like molecule 8 [Rousettus aegyptiacus]